MCVCVDFQDIYFLRIFSPKKYYACEDYVTKCQAAYIYTFFKAIEITAKQVSRCHRVTLDRGSMDAQWNMNYQT